MKDSQTNEAGNQVLADAARRDFLKMAGTVAVTAPAVAILLRASTASATGTNPYGKDGTDHEIPVYTLPGDNKDLFNNWYNHIFNWR